MNTRNTQLTHVPAAGSNGNAPAAPASAAPAAQARPARPAMPRFGGGIRALMDRLPRRRDARGNRLPSRGAWHTPLPMEGALTGTALERVLAQIAEARPQAAAWLHYRHDILQGQREQSEAVVREAEQENDIWNAHAVEVALAVDAEQAMLRAEAEAAAAPHTAEAAALDTPLGEAHAEAALLSAAAGREYDPASPSPETLLRVEPRSLQELAAEMRVPDPAADRRHRILPALSVLSTLLVGCVVGMSLGLMMGVLHADALDRNPIGLVAAALAGCGAVWLAGLGVSFLHRLASQHGYLGRPWQERAALVAGALALDCGLVLVDLVVEREGILRLARAASSVAALSNRAAGGSPDWVWWVAPLIVTLGYVVVHACEGHVAGRVEAVENRLLLEQAEDHRRRTEAHRTRPEVQRALDAVHQTLELLRRRQEHQGRAEAVAAAFQPRIDAAEALRREPREGFTPEQLARMQDAQENLNGANDHFHAALTQELRLLARIRSRWLGWLYR